MQTDQDPILHFLEQLDNNNLPDQPRQLPFPPKKAPSMSWAFVCGRARQKMGPDNCKTTVTTAKQSYVDTFFEKYDRISYLALPPPERDFCEFLYAPIMISNGYEHAQANLMLSVNGNPSPWSSERDMSYTMTTVNGLNGITAAVASYLKLPDTALRFRLQERDPAAQGEENARCDGIFVLDKNPGAVEDLPPDLPVLRRVPSPASSLISSRSSHHSHRSTSSMSSTLSQASVHSNWVPPPPSRPVNDNTLSHHVCHHGYVEFKRTAVIPDLLAHIKDMAHSPKEPVAISKPTSALTAPQYVKVLSQVSD